MYQPLPQNDDGGSVQQQQQQPSSKAIINSDDQQEEDDVIEDLHLSLEAGGTDVSNMASLMNVIKGNLGTGILAMPIAIKNMGLLLGTLSILFIGVMATHCMHLLLASARNIRDRDGVHYLDYAELMYKATQHRFPNSPRMWKHFRNFVNVSLLITQIGFCCVYILFIADNVNKMVDCYSPDFNIDIHLWKFFVLLLLVPYVFVKHLKLLGYFSTLANLATAIGLVIIFVFCIQDIDFKPAQFSLVEPVANWPISFGIIIFAFEGISLVLPIESSMRKPRDFIGFSGVLQLGMTIVISLYTSVGFYGFLRFNKDVEASITLNIPCDKNVWHAAVKPLFCLALYVSYGLQFYVPAEILTAAMRRRIENVEKHWIGDAVIRVAMTIFTFVAAATIPHLDLMIALIGAFSSSCLALIFPAIIDFFLLSNDSKCRSLKMVKNIFIGGFGLAGFIIGTVTTLIQIGQAFHNDYIHHGGNVTLTLR